MRKAVTLFVTILLTVSVASAQKVNLKNRLAEYFRTYDMGFVGSKDYTKIEDITVGDADRTLHIWLSEYFGMQHFTPEKIESVKRDVRRLLPAPYNTYTLRIYSKKVLLEDLLPGGSEEQALPRTWAQQKHKALRWVTPLDLAAVPSKGLAGRHLALWASHGRYFDQKKGVWQWQRPYLYCTTEDLLTQTIVVPYLMPMLEHAGAILYTPRERDWQRHESIVDNDRPLVQGTYNETSGALPWENAGVGFAHTKVVYQDKDNPFTDGTARKVATQGQKRQASSVVWTPEFAEDGHYAVYVSYKTLPTSVPDAVYTVRHRGVNSRFRVNQQMGGGTWVYLGTFDFGKDNARDNCVSLSNVSDYRGHITADAVRFGGGMGNIGRGPAGTVSGMPRFLEGARYAAQWAGMPYEVYGCKESTNDYAEDINVRSHALNYMAGGSDYLSRDSAGLKVPIELSIGIHSDAGYRPTDEIIGTLSIYMTDWNEGIYPSGLTRLTARDLADGMMAQVSSDLTALCGRWNLRQMYDRNYSEARLPEVPGIILETLSHQNFYDLRYMHDPTFKFVYARAIYKGILRYVARMHGEENPVVQPLPVAAMQTQVNADAGEVTLRWQGVADPQEPTATSTGYIVYHAEGDADYDNGTYTEAEEYVVAGASAMTLHRFRVAAVNAGGESMPSREVCAFLAAPGSREICILDAFDRLAGPLPFENDTLMGFDLGAHPGIPMPGMPGYCGYQVDWNKAGLGKEGPGALGFSDTQLENVLVAGNTLDWSIRHARDIVAATSGAYHITSATTDALSRGDATIVLARSAMVDVIGGLQCDDGYSLCRKHLFTPALVDALRRYTASGGSVLLTGSYVGSDATDDDTRLFLQQTLKYRYGGTLSADSITSIQGMQQDFVIHHTLNETSYCVKDIEVLEPAPEAFTTMIYAPLAFSSAIAYQGNDYRALVMGFPLESITSKQVRQALWAGLLPFLLP